MQLIFNGIDCCNIVSTPSPIQLAVGIFRCEQVVCVCVSHATEYCYGVLTCAVHFTVLLFKVHDRMHSTIYFLSLSFTSNQINLVAYKGNCQLDFSPFYFTCTRTLETHRIDLFFVPTMKIEFLIVT